MPTISDLHYNLCYGRYGVVNRNTNYVTGWWTLRTFVYQGHSFGECALCCETPGCMAGDMRRHSAHYGVTVMPKCHPPFVTVLLQHDFKIPTWWFPMPWLLFIARTSTNVSTQTSWYQITLNHEYPKCNVDKNPTRLRALMKTAVPNQNRPSVLRNHCLRKATYSRNMCFLSKPCDSSSWW